MLHVLAKEFDILRADYGQLTVSQIAKGAFPLGVTNWPGEYRDPFGPAALRNEENIGIVSGFQSELDSHLQNSALQFQNKGHECDIELDAD